MHCWRQRYSVTASATYAMTLVTAWMPWRRDVDLLVSAGTSTRLDWIQCGFKPAAHEATFLAHCKQFCGKQKNSIWTELAERSDTGVESACCRGSSTLLGIGLCWASGNKLYWVLLLVYVSFRTAHFYPGHWSDVGTESRFSLSYACVTY
jgi:hypothetical protein